MTETGRFIARACLATGATGLMMAIFRPPQPFLAVLAAFLMLARPFTLAEMPVRLMAAWGGVIAGMAVVVLFPQQPWFLFPAYGLVVLAAIHCAARTGNPSVAVLVVMGLGAALPAGLIDPTNSLAAGWAHGWNLTIGLTAAWLAFALFPAAAAPSGAAFSAGRAPYIALALVLASWAAVTLLPSAAVVLVIAAATTAVGVSQPNAPACLGQKSTGAVLGAALSVLFDSVVAGSGNSLAVFLVALMIFVGALAWCMRQWPRAAPCFTQCCAMFVVAAPMLPDPDSSLGGMGIRVAAVLVGFGTAGALYGLAQMARPGVPAGAVGS